MFCRPLSYIVFKLLFLNIIRATFVGFELVSKLISEVISKRQKLQLAGKELNVFNPLLHENTF